jgi:DMSO/TMAO reductase YedYZ molybdopterin-dependent catalytic subunit
LILCFSALELANATEHFNSNDENHINHSEWTLFIDGQVDQTLNLTLDDIMRMPETQVNADLYCFNDLLNGGAWIGVKLGLLLDQAGPNEGAKYVQLFASDGYSTSLDLSIAIQQDVIIAYQLNGQTLPEFLRLVLPNQNGEEWIALITKITVVEIPVSFPAQTNSPSADFREAIKSQTASLSKDSIEATEVGSDSNDPLDVFPSQDTSNPIMQNQEVLQSLTQPTKPAHVTNERTEPEATIEWAFITKQVPKILVVTVAMIICLANFWALRKGK